MVEFFEMEIEILDLEIEILEMEIEIIECENEEVHFVSKPIKCKLCHKIFSAASTLKLHEEIIHTDHIKFIFKDQLHNRNEGLKDTIIKTENETVDFFYYPFQCNTCLKTFAATSTLKLHMEISHANTNKTNDIIFEKEADFEKHKNDHTGERCESFPPQFQHFKIRSINSFSEEKYLFYDCERFMKRYSPRIEEEFSDTTMACKVQHLKTHKMAIFNRAEYQKTKALKEDDVQNYVFQVF